jgi:4-diphosphocytidyl-2-C-methyl-D-erythritol kinase
MLSVQTPAKINLFLNIRSRRADGYHTLCSVMQAVRLWDRLDVTPREDERPDIQFSCNLPAFEYRAKDNLVVKAYHLFWDKTGLPPLGLKVHLQKEIPVQAGLGGGSSNAAAMLGILNHLSHAGLTAEQLRVLGAELGSDVPFFISGGTALASGRGEIVAPLPVNFSEEERPVVIIKPLNLNIETALAYHRFASAARYESQSPDHLLLALKEGLQKRRQRDEVDLESYLLNDFERVLFPEYPMLSQMARQMREAGVRRPLLSGSGSAMFGFVESSRTTRKALQEFFPKEQYDIFWTQTYPGGPMQITNALSPDDMLKALI